MTPNCVLTGGVSVVVSDDGNLLMIRCADKRENAHVLESFLWMKLWETFMAVDMIVPSTTRHVHHLTIHTDTDSFRLKCHMNEQSLALAANKFVKMIVQQPTSRETPLL